MTYILYINFIFLQMYHNFISDFEHRINSLTFMEIIVYVVRQMKGMSCTSYILNKWDSCGHHVDMRCPLHLLHYEVILQPLGSDTKEGDQIFQQDASSCWAKCSLRRLATFVLWVVLVYG